MHIGTWAHTNAEFDPTIKQEEVLFGMHYQVVSQEGDEIRGSCNEAEYFGLLKTLTELKKVIEERNWQGCHVVIKSDSQLMTKQMMGLWKVTHPAIRCLYDRVQQMRKTLPFTFEVEWINRTENGVANSWAESVVTVGSARNMRHEDGWHRVRRHTPNASFLGFSRKGAVQENPAERLLKNVALAEKRQLLIRTILRTKKYDGCLYLVREMRQTTAKQAGNLPKINEVADEWIRSTFASLDTTLSEIEALLASRKYDALPEYLVENYRKLGIDSSVIEEYLEEAEGLNASAQPLSGIWEIVANNMGAMAKPAKTKVVRRKKNKPAPNPDALRAVV
jgi:ribonuclease HI